MTTHDDPLDEALDAMATPALDATFAGRVLALARGELPAQQGATAARLGPALRGALVPALLASAAVVRTASTVEASIVIYHHEAPDPPRR